MNTVIIPTYSEQENIAELKRRLPKDVNVLIVDDSPNELTADAARSAGFQVLHRNGKKGLSSAVIDGLRICDSEKVIIMDADLQHPPELIPELLKQLDTHDLVVASRYVDGGGCQDWDLDRKVISKVANLAARPLTNIRDAVSGFFGLRRSMLPDLNGLNSRGFKIMLELLVTGNWNSVVEVPYTFETRKRGHSKLGWKQITGYLLQLVSLYLYKYRILRFMIIGATGTVINLASLYLLNTFVIHKAFTANWTTAVADRSYLAAFIPAFLLSVVSNYLLNNLWTFRERIAGKAGFWKYLLMACTTLPIDISLVYIFTEYAGLYYILSAAITILITFIIRYTISKKFIWKGQR